MSIFDVYNINFIDNPEYMGFEFIGIDKDESNSYPRPSFMKSDLQIYKEKMKEFAVPDYRVKIELRDYSVNPNGKFIDSIEILDYIQNDQERLKRFVNRIIGKKIIDFFDTSRRSYKDNHYDNREIVYTLCEQKNGIVSYIELKFIIQALTITEIIGKWYDDGFDFD